MGKLAVFAFVFALAFCQLVSAAIIGGVLVTNEQYRQSTDAGSAWMNAAFIHKTDYTITDVTTGKDLTSGGTACEKDVLSFTADARGTWSADPDFTGADHPINYLPNAVYNTYVSKWDSIGDTMNDPTSPPANSPQEYPGYQSRRKFTCGPVGDKMFDVSAGISCGSYYLVSEDGTIVYKNDALGTASTLTLSGTGTKNFIVRVVVPACSAQAHFVHQKDPCDPTGTSYIQDDRIFYGVARYGEQLIENYPTVKINVLGLLPDFVDLQAGEGTISSSGAVVSSTDSRPECWVNYIVHDSTLPPGSDAQSGGAAGCFHSGNIPANADLTWSIKVKNVNPFDLKITQITQEAGWTLPNFAVTDGIGKTIPANGEITITGTAKAPATPNLNPWTVGQYGLALDIFAQGQSCTGSINYNHIWPLVSYVDVFNPNKPDLKAEGVIYTGAAPTPGQNEVTAQYDDIAHLYFKVTSIGAADPAAQFSITLYNATNPLAPEIFPPASTYDIRVTTGIPAAADGWYKEITADVKCSPEMNGDWIYKIVADSRVPKEVANDADPANNEATVTLHCTPKVFSCDVDIPASTTSGVVVAAIDFRNIDPAKVRASVVPPDPTTNGIPIPSEVTVTCGPGGTLTSPVSQCQLDAPGLTTGTCTGVVCTYPVPPAGSTISRTIEASIDYFGQDPDTVCSAGTIDVTNAPKYECIDYI
ncbi:Uncharacterised protein [Candidatus Gugararchaeum adminiculabundum]|nr:Uncharacterised protein [Candidatus Gugararchaeum adminiculabundum]